jgi:3-phosphoshikimate 1-carboxyvinyltransferase
VLPVLIRDNYFEVVKYTGWLVVKEIIPCSAINAEVQLPGSKYIANRLIPMCALAKTPSVLHNVVDNDDISAAIDGLNALGYQLSLCEGSLKINPRERDVETAVELNTHHSGTFSRFVTAIAALNHVEVRINCSAKMATRPMNELFSSLEQLGVEVDSNDMCLPATIKGPISEDSCSIDASRSSQFLSALLIIGAALENGITIELVGPQVSNSYVQMTLFWMSKLGIKVQQSESQYRIPEQQYYIGAEITIPGDAVSASYFMGLVGIAGGKLLIREFDFDSLQGEAQFYKVLELMGMTFERSGNDLLVVATGRLSSVEVDMGEMPDVVQTLAVMACYAEGVTHISNIAHLAYKESNRIIDTARELAKTGIKVEYGNDSLTIHGGTPEAAVIETYDDHRMAMSMALLGARAKGVQIKDHQVVNKSFPSYWTLMQQSGLSST